MKNKKTLFFFSTLFVILLFCYFVILPDVFAEYGLEDAEKIKGLSTKSIPEYVGGIINAVVGILGVILVALIIYGGVLYMTSAGSEERAKTAKSILTYAIIGVVIVFASYIISKFVLSAITGEYPEEWQTTESANTTLEETTTPERRLEGAEVAPRRDIDE